MSVRHHPKAAAPVQGGGGAKCTRQSIDRNPYMHKHIHILPAHSHMLAADALHGIHNKKLTSRRGGDLSAGGDNTCPTKAAAMLQPCELGSR